MFKNLNIKIFIYVLLGLSAFFWYGIAVLSGQDVSTLWRLLKLLPKVVTADLLIFFVFARWGWKIKIFQGWLVPFPNLNGTWQGVIKTTWVDPKTNTSPSPIPVILTVKQSFTHISCVMRTAEMASYSFAEDFRLDGENQIKQLIYSYASNPKPTVTDRSVPHYGTIILDIISTPAQKLKGQYWTARKSTGEIELHYRERKLLDDLPEDLGAHPMAKTG
jgi:hypothetical protein